MQITLKRQLRYGTRTVYAETRFIPQPDGMVRVEFFSTRHDGSGVEETDAPSLMTEEAANEFKAELLSAREVVGRTAWTAS